MSLGISKRYEISYTWNVLEDEIFTNLTDPAIPKRQKSGDWIKNSFPNPGDLDKKEGWKFPLVEIELPKINSNILTADGQIEKLNHSIPITVHSKTKLEAIQMSEEIKYILTVTAYNDFIKAAIQLNGINGTSDSFDFISGNKYYSYTIDYNFQRVD